MYEYTFAVSCKFNGQVNYFGISIPDFVGNGYIQSVDTMGGITCDVSLKTLTAGYLEFKVDSDGTPAQAVCTISYEAEMTDGSREIIQVNLEFDNSEETWNSAIGLFAFDMTSLYAIQGQAQSIPVPYHTMNVNALKSNYYTSATWAVLKHNGYVLTLDVSRNEGNEGGGVRTAEVSCEGYLDELDDWFEPVSFTLAQDGTPAEESFLAFSPSPIRVDAAAQTVYVEVEQQNITSLTVSPNDLWFGVFYDSANSRIRVTVQANSDYKRISSIAVRASGSDGKDYRTAILIVQADAQADGSIVCDSNVEVSYIASSGTVDYTLDNVADSSLTITSTFSWIRNLTASGGQISFSVTQNPNKADREGEIKISGTAGGGGTVYKSITVLQLAAPDMVEFPIWDDYFLSFDTDADYVDYRITDLQDAVFQGRAFAIEGVARVYVNDILSDMLSERIDLSDYELQDNRGYVSFVVQVYDTNLQGWYDYILLNTYNDWTYSHNTESGIISDRIQKVLDIRQLFVQSYLKKVGDSTPEFSISGPRRTSSRPYNRTFTLTDGIQSMAVKAGILNTLYVTEDGDVVQEYPVEDTCKPYALYWLNAKGGYNSMLLNKASKQVDRIQNYDYTKFASINDTVFHKIQYLKEITNTWTIKTDILTDRESEIVAEIAHSPQVYLHILEDDEIIPVNITDTQVEHKLWRNNQRKHITYSFTVENSLTKERK